MSRFDRRLKGTGLKPGESTCNIKKREQSMLSKLQKVQTQKNMVHTQSLTGQPILNDGKQFKSANSKLSPENELAVKNAQLENYANTAATHELRLLTRHEIRLNNLEAYTLQMPGKTDNLLGEINFATMKNKIIQEIKPQINPLTSDDVSNLKRDVLNELKSDAGMKTLKDSIRIEISKEINKGNRNKEYDLRFLNYDKKFAKQEKVIREQRVEIETLQKRLNEMLSRNDKSSELVFEIKEELPVKQEQSNNDIRKVVMEAINEEENKRKDKEVTVQN
tara:strand:- start:435 stop:1268 length:834 start_codon:yes stop_codon:yes gene_type:complete